MKAKLKNGMSHREQEVYFSLLNREKTVVNILQVAKEHGIKGGNARKVLFSLARKRVLHRIGKGLYVVIPPDMLYSREKFINDPYMIIDQLMGILGEKYYLGYQNAAHLHGAAEQLPMAASVAVLKQRRPIKIGSNKIQFIKISEDDFFGMQRIKYSNAFLNVSDVEKTIIDCVKRYDLCGGMDEAARTISNLLERVDREKLSSYINRIKKRSVNQRIGFVLEKLSGAGYGIDKMVLDELGKQVSGNVYLLDPKAHRRGRLSEKWGIIENVDIMRW